MKNKNILYKTYVTRKKISNYCLTIAMGNDSFFGKTVMKFEKWVYPEGVIESF